MKGKYLWISWNFSQEFIWLFLFFSGFPTTVETKVFPSTADDALQQYVCLTLVVDISPGYPDVVPNVQLRNPRGLDDSVLIRIEKEIKEKCSNFCGQPVIYELIEVFLNLHIYIFISNFFSDSI